MSLFSSTRFYRTVDSSHIDMIDFENVISDPESASGLQNPIRYNNAGDRFILEYSGECPLDVEACASSSREYNWQEAVQLMNSSGWKITNKVGGIS